MQTCTEIRADRVPFDTGQGISEVRILRTLEDIEGIREFWSSSTGTFDSDIDVFLARPASVQEGLRILVLAIYRDHKPVALMAGTILRERYVFRLGWLPLFKPLVDVLTIRGEARGETSLENCKLLVRTLNKCLRNGEAHLAVLPHVELDSALYRCLKVEPPLLFRDHFTPIRLHRSRKLPSSVDEFYAGLSANGRMTFRRIAKRLHRDFSGHVRVDRIDKFNSASDLDRTLAIVNEVAKKTWQRAMAGGLHMSVSQIEAFRKQAEKGWLQVYILYLAEKPCAFLLGAVYRRVFFAEYIGYDPAYAHYSLGTFLLSQVMERFCPEGIEAIDFASSDEEYKKRFSNSTRSETDFHLFAPSLMGFTLSAMETVRVSLNEIARAVLKRTNLIQPVKRIWRKVRSRKMNAAQLEPQQ